jgi:hypothetical protein
VAVGAIVKPEPPRTTKVTKITKKGSTPGDIAAVLEPCGKSFVRFVSFVVDLTHSVNLCGTVVLWKTCGCTVKILCTNRQRDFFSGASPSRNTPDGHCGR